MGVTKEITKPAPAGAAKPVKGQKPFPPFFFFFMFLFQKKARRSLFIAPDLSRPQRRSFGQRKIPGRLCFRFASVYIFFFSSFFPSVFLFFLLIICSLFIFRQGRSHQGMGRRSFVHANWRMCYFDLHP